MSFKFKCKCGSLSLGHVNDANDNDIAFCNGCHAIYRKKLKSEKECEIIIPLPMDPPPVKPIELPTVPKGKFFEGPYGLWFPGYTTTYTATDGNTVIRDPETRKTTKTAMYVIRVPQFRDYLEEYGIPYKYPEYKKIVWIDKRWNPSDHLEKTYFDFEIEPEMELEHTGKFLL